MTGNEEKGNQRRRGNGKEGKEKGQVKNTKGSVKRETPGWKMKNVSDMNEERGKY